MTESMLSFLRCPVTRSQLSLQVIETGKKGSNNRETEIIHQALLFASEDWVYPVIDGIPRLLIESFLEHEVFLRANLADFPDRKKMLLQKYPELIKYAEKKNKKTKQSFEQEWKLFDYNKDKTWGADRDEMLNRFLLETGETASSLKGKLIFDAGCGNGLLNQLIAKQGASVLGMDFSRSIEKAFQENNEPNAFFIQGDVQSPPVVFELFDIVHCSGVLIHTNNTEKSFHCIEPCVRKGGKLSVWLYHPQKDIIHNLLLQIRKLTSRLPIRIQYYLYKTTLLPVSFLIKRIKGNKQSSREMMIELLDQFSPEFRWEHRPEEVMGWFQKKNYASVTITTETRFGYNITGIKNNA